MKYALIFFLNFITIFSHASFFIEPLVGYKAETIKLTDLALTQSEIKASQPYFGARLGYRTMTGIELVIAGERSSGTATVSTQLEKNKFNHNTISAQLGVNSFGLIKMYLGAALSNEFNLQESTTLQGFKLSGPAFQVGLQLKAFLFVNLGLQYNLNQFNKIEGTNYALGSKTESYFSKLDSQDYNIYLSTSF